MRKISLAVIAFSLINVSASAIDLSEFTGDTKLSCEAVLCLASPYKPSECALHLLDILDLVQDIGVM